ncbi:hypothetical protein D3C86_1446810 [compost metagenome]
MGVLEAFPALAQGLDIHLGVRLLGLRGGLGRQGEVVVLLGALEARDQRVEGAGVGLAGLEDLVDGLALLVEELEAAAGAAGGLLDQGEAHVPAREEDAQVDLLAEDGADLAVELGHGVGAGLLDHGVVVAGQGHHGAEGRDPLEDGLPVARETHGTGAELGGDEVGLAHAEAGRGVALAQAGLGLTQGGPALKQIGGIEGQLAGHGGSRFRGGRGRQAAR